MTQSRARATPGRRAAGPGWILVLACLVVAPVNPAVAVPRSADVYGALPQTEHVALSPDGSLLAWNEAGGPLQKIVVFDVNSDKDKRVQGLPASSKLRGLRWSDNETLLIEFSFTDPNTKDEKERAEYWRIVALNVNSGANQGLLMAGGGFRALVNKADIVATHTGKPKTILMSTADYKESEERMQTGSRVPTHASDTGWRLNLYEVDTRSGQGKRIEEGDPFTTRWVVDRDGRVVARAEWKPEGREYRVLAKSGSGWREIYHQEKLDRLSLAGTTPDGKAVMALGAMGGNNKLWAIPLDGSAPRVVADDESREVEGMIFDRFTLAPVAVVLGGPERTYKWLDADHQKRFDMLKSTFEGKRVALYDSSQDYQRVIAAVDSHSLPTVYYLVDFNTHHAEIIGEEYPGLASADRGDAKAISYKARDGMEIPAYLTLPPGVEAKNLPLVVLPHGGPEDRDEPGFDWWAQFLATRGYAVLQPQFRGSTGFGDAYRLAGRQQWGGLMQDDVSDGVKSLIAQGIADAHRVCIVGASYGGYAALAGAAFTPELYACAVSVNGIGDLPEMRYWIEQHTGSESNAVAYWRESIGARLEPMQAHSPRNAAERFRAPVLIMYSGDDTVVPPSQSLDMAKTLTNNGKSVRLVKLEGDDHWLSRGASRTQMLKELETFLAAQLH